MFGVPQILRPASRINLNDTPLQIPDLGLWLRADAATVLNSIAPNVACTDGQAVRRWMDQSGNGRHFDQSTAANQPLLRTSGINGQPAIDFDGINDLLSQLTGLDMTNNAAALSVFAVAKADSATVSASEFIFQISDGTATLSSRASINRVTGNQDQIGGRRVDGSSFASVNPSAATTAAKILSARFEFSGANLDGFADGSETVLNPFQTAGNTSATDALSTQIGARSDASNPFPGLIAEVLVYPRALTDAEVWTMHRYLSLRYGIPLAV